jgi:asparagine synthase (glutamine-hydrolysing)
MCGIAGVYSYQGDEPVNREALVRMTRRLAHRGPDDEGIFVEGPIGLGLRRLSIVDLSPTGAQPMSTLDGRAVIVYNGEFYNHTEFRRQLEARGVRFRGTSDTETLLYLLAEYGPDALRDVAGIFGLAFWDKRTRRLLLARDPLGVKQVYLHDNAQRIVFGSEIKALLLYPGVSARVDPEGVNQYLHFHTPLFERTFFEGIRQLQPGEFMEVAQAGVRKKRYWQLDGFESKFRNAEEAVDELRNVLAKVVREQLMSDVPLGAFFSGGIDSTAVASFASRSGKRVQCFGVHFSGQGVIDERPFQELAAKALQVPLELTTVNGDSFPADMERLLYFQDQPMIGAAMIPMYYVSRLAAAHVKVCLGGQAGDEIFGGYARYGLGAPFQAASRWWLGREVQAGGAQGHRYAQGAPEGQLSRVRDNLLRQLSEPRTLVRLARTLVSGLDWTRRYFDNFAAVPERDWLKAFEAREFVSRKKAWQIFREGVSSSPAPDPPTRLMHWDQRTYLPGLFSQDDRMSMANSLESRVPLADPRIVRFAFHIPFEWKFRAGASKWILRQAVADAVPEYVLNRRKVGFDTPAEAWMKGRNLPWVWETLTGSAARSRGLFNVHEVERLLGRPEHPRWFPVIWKLLCIEVWARQFLDGEGCRSVPDRAEEGVHAT